MQDQQLPPFNPLSPVRAIGQGIRALNKKKEEMRMARIRSDHRDMLHYGYRTYTGKVLCDTHVDVLNRMYEDINAYVDAGKGVPEELLNDAHRTFVMFAEGY